MKRPSVMATVLALLTGLPAISTAAESEDLPTLDRALVKLAPKLVRYLQDQDHSNVGLKFQVSTDGKTRSDNVGTLNMRLARELELALLVRNNARKPLGIVRNASAVALRTTGATHLTRDGRLKLFGAKYPLHWGNKVVEVDAFLTGVGIISSDLQKLTLAMYAFNRKDNTLAPLKAFDLTVRMDAGKLGEAGESFLLRGDGSDEPDEQARKEKLLLAAARQSKTAKSKHPAFGSDAPVTLEVLYDGKPAPITFKDGQAMLPTPRLGQKVVLVLRRDKGKEKYGVVLKVNGENTLFRQRLPDLECRRWILYPKSEPLKVEGYQIDRERYEEFRVATRPESEKLAMNYGEDVGLISVTVFRERKGDEPTPDPLDRDGPKAEIVRKGKLPQETPENYEALLAQLEEEANRSRGGDEGGALTGGATKKGGVTTVSFKPNPIPVMSLTIRYYQASGRPD